MKPASSATVPLSVASGGEFEVRIENRVATVTLNRPDRKNPLTFASYEALADLFRAAAKDDSGAVSTFVVRGAGGDFCSGGDVFEIIGPLTKMDTRDLLKFTKMTGELVKAMRACPQPIVAAIEGVCAGAGAIIAMASDIRVAAPSAKTAFLFNRVGLAGCDMGACAMLPRIIGQGRASELLYTGRAMTADEGLAWGFHSRVVEAGDLYAEATKLAEEIASGPNFAHAMTKRMLQVEWAMSIDDAIESEAVAQALCMTTQDFTRAFEAFSERRKPVFQGD
jgi:enoyl-CoA hydratase/carnithine racemase